MEIKGDNEGCVILTHNPQFYQQSKHITIHHHWFQDLVTVKVFNIQNCCDLEQTAIVFTRSKSMQHRDERRIQSVQ